jgi:hypothetical protein
LDEGITVERSPWTAQVWVSLRLLRREVALIDKLAVRTGQTRGSLLKQILILGIREHYEAEAPVMKRQENHKQTEV